jgi:hypothetical protein
MDDKLEELLRVAKSRTVDGELRWRAFSDEAFRVPIGGGYLHVNRGMIRLEDEDGESHPARTYSAQVTDEQGRVVAETDATVGYDGPVALLSELFEAARKSALQSEGVIEKMLGALRGRP